MDRTRAALVAVGLLAAVLGPVGSAAAATGNVDVEDYRFAPTEIRIEAGDRVRWTSQGDQTHTVTTDDAGAEDFDSGRMSKGDEYTHTFGNEGRFTYHCEIYSSMSGVVQVGSPAAPTTTSTTTAPTTSTTTTSTTTTTRPAPTTTTTRQAPATTTTTAPPAPTTTVTTVRAPSGAESPPPASSPAPTTTTRPAAPTTTTAPPETTTTTAPTTTTTAPATPEEATPLGPEVPPPPPPQEEDGEGDLAGQTAASPRRESTRGADFTVLLLIAALLGAGGFGLWTLWKLRPDNTA